MANEQKHARLQISTPVGRFVAGDLQKKSDQGHGGKKRETPQFYFALAILKSTPGVNELLGAIYQHALLSYGQFPNIANLIQQYPLPGPYVPEPQRRPFAWKVQDGDWPAHQGKEGYANSWIFGFSTSQDFNMCDANGNQIDKAQAHLGMFGQVSGNVAINGLADANCGIYMNPNWVKLVADGPLIVTGPTAEQAFANAPAAILPPGATPFVAGGGQRAPSVPSMPTLPAGLTPPPQQPQAPRQPAPPPPPPAAPSAEQIAAQWGVQHHPGYRYNPQTNAYDADAAGNPPVAVQAAQVPATVAPAGGFVPGGSTGIASPSNGVPQYPNVQPHAAFVTGQR